MKSIQVTIELFGILSSDEEKRPIILEIDSEINVTELIEKSSKHFSNKFLSLISKEIVERKDLSSCVILVDGNRITDYDVLCSTRLENGSTVTIMLPMVAG